MIDITFLPCAIETREVLLRIDMTPRLQLVTSVILLWNSFFQPWRCRTLLRKLFFHTETGMGPPHCQRLSAEQCTRGSVMTSSIGAEVAPCIDGCRLRALRRSGTAVKLGIADLFCAGSNCIMLCHRPDT